jgi:hypothetical protein
MERKELIRECLDRGATSKQIYLCFSLNFTPPECITKDYDCPGVKKWKEKLMNEEDEEEGAPV